MKRTTAAALLAAGIVGIVGGTVSAVVRGEDAATGPGGPESSPTGTPASRPATPLWATEGTIHDGTRSIEWDAPRALPAQLVRTHDGYLLGFATRPQEPVSQLWAVDVRGDSKRIADVVGSWDLDAGLTRVVGTDRDSGKVTVWDLAGTVQATWRSFTGRYDPVWVDDEVMVNPERDGALPLTRWDPGTGTVSRSSQTGYSHLTASPDMQLLGGRVSSDGAGTNADSDHCIGAQRYGTDGSQAWYTCDWRSNVEGLQFSPGSDKVLAIPFQSDGFGPGTFAVFSATEGPKKGVTELDAPDATLGAEWLDEDHLLLYGASDLDLDENTSMWVRRCDLQGSCTDVGTSAKGSRLVVATLR